MNSTETRTWPASNVSLPAKSPRQISRILIDAARLFGTLLRQHGFGVTGLQSFAYAGGDQKWRLKSLVAYKCPKLSRMIYRSGRGPGPAKSDLSPFPFPQLRLCHYQWFHRLILAFQNPWIHFERTLDLSRLLLWGAAVPAAVPALAPFPALFDPCFGPGFNLLKDESAASGISQ